jgi:hypothetical protein
LQRCGLSIVDVAPIGGTVIDSDHGDQAAETRRSADSIADARRASPPAPFKGEA